MEGAGDTNEKPPNTPQTCRGREKQVNHDYRHKEGDPFTGRKLLSYGPRYPMATSRPKANGHPRLVCPPALLKGPGRMQPHQQGIGRDGRL